MTSLQLTDKWDLTLTPGGNLAVVDADTRIVQDVACYERTFSGEPWYNTEAGVPYLNRELAYLPPAELVIERANRRALEVPGVSAVDTSLLALESRQLSGTINVTTTGGDILNVSI